MHTMAGSGSERHGLLGTTMNRRRSLQLAGGAFATASLLVGSCTSGDDSPGVVDDGAREAPMLAERVAAGDLPPLEERLPVNPMVVEPIDSVGRYGGTLRRAQLSETSAATWEAFSTVTLVQWSLDATTAEPNVAETFEASEDLREFTFVLREGVRWSDGEPFGKDDIDFALTHIWSDEELFPAPPRYWVDSEGGRPTYEWLDDRTLRITFAAPNAVFVQYMCHPSIGLQLIVPSHVLSTIHPATAGEEEAEKVAKAAGFDTWVSHFQSQLVPWLNPELPVLGAYRMVESAQGSGSGRLERNPYFWKVDPDGRQLPYIDAVSVQILGQDSLDLRAANGELDFQGLDLAFSSAQLLLAQAEAKGYTVQRWKNRQTLSICPNISHQDPAMREVFADVRFRQALSHAIDREAINRALLNGLGRVEHPMLTIGIQDAKGGDRYLDHDPDRANALLDEIGMTTKGQWRTLPGGDTFEPTIMFVENNTQVPRADALQMVVQDLAKVGLKVVLRPVDGTLYAQLRMANDFDLNGSNAAGGNFEMDPVWYIPIASNGHFAPGYGEWYASGGNSGMKPTAEMMQLTEAWEQFQSGETEAVRDQAREAIRAQHDEMIYMIGIVGVPFDPVVVSQRLHNVRTDGPPLSNSFGREGFTRAEQIWLEA